MIEGCRSKPCVGMINMRSLFDYCTAFSGEKKRDVRRRGLTVGVGKDFVGFGDRIGAGVGGAFDAGCA